MKAVGLQLAWCTLKLNFLPKPSNTDSFHFLKIILDIAYPRVNAIKYGFLMRFDL